MSKGRKPLDHEQQKKLRYVADADDAWRKAKKYEYERARKQAEDRIAQFAWTRDRAVFDAVQAGIPKAVIGRDGLGTTNPYAVNEAYNRAVESTPETPVELPKTPTDQFAWGKVLAFDERWVYGWVTDTESPGVITGSMGQSGEGYFVVVDRMNEAVTTLYTPDRILTTHDSGWEDLREWAVTHQKEAEGVHND